MDFIVKLPLSKTYNTILTITDTFSKASILIPCHETIDATGVAQLYANYVLPHYGLPLRIISDRDPRFTSSFFRELCRVIGATQNLSTAYRPQTDGQLEWTNQRLEQYIRIFTVFEQNNWANLLALAQYTLNSWPNATTKKAPYELLLGYIPQVHQTVRTSNNPGLEE
jgi:transposase InsO family protein